MTDVARLQAMMARACFGAEEPAPSEAELRAALRAQGIGEGDADAFANAPRRLALYRRLVRHNVVSVVRTMLERTRERADAHAPGAFDALVSAFLDEVGPRTPHLRDVPSELLAWAAPRMKGDPRLPPWLADHAELELVDFTIGVAPRPAPPPPVTDIGPDSPLVFAEPKVIVRLAWAVHELAARGADAAPDARDVAILVYRDAEHRTRMLELTPLAAAILERLFEGRPLAPAVVEACAAHARAVDAPVLEGASRLLADLGDRGVLLGARA